jgi:hypothetical protein
VNDGPRPRWLWLVSAEAGSAPEVAAAAACRAAVRAGWSSTVVLPWRSAERIAGTSLGVSFGAPGEIVERRPVEIGLEHTAFRGELRREGERADGLTCWWAMPQSAALAPPLHAAFLAAAALELVRELGAAGIVLCGLGSGLLPMLLNTRFGAHPQLENLRTFRVLDRLTDAGWIDSATLRELGLPGSLGEAPFGIDGSASVERAALLQSDGIVVAPGRGVREAAIAAATSLDPTLGEILQSRQDAFLPFPWHVDRGSVSSPVSADDQAAKAPAKAAALGLIERSGEAVDPRPPLVVLLEPSAAALDLLVPVLPIVAKQRARLAIVAATLPDSLASEGVARVGLEHRDAMLLGADILLAVEPWEPFGLDVARALRFGTLPVFFAGGASALAAGPHGFPFKTALSSSLQRALGAALSAYRSSSEWRKLRAAAMRFEDPWAATFKRWQGTWRDALARPVRRVEMPSPQRAVADSPDRALREPSREVYIDWGPALPERYGEDAIALLVQSPRALLVYWDTRVVEGQSADRLLRLRVSDGSTVRELATVGPWGDFWIPAEPGRTYRAELVEIDDASTGRGERVVLRSDPAVTPSDRPSASARVRWHGGGAALSVAGGSDRTAVHGSEALTQRSASAADRTPDPSKGTIAQQPGSATAPGQPWVPGLRSVAPPVRGDHRTRRSRRARSGPSARRILRTQAPAFGW